MIIKIRRPSSRLDRRLLRKLGMDDWREFAIALGEWASQKDFTYQSDLYDPRRGATFMRMLQAFVKDRLL